VSAGHARFIERRVLIIKVVVEIKMFILKKDVEE